MYYSYLLSSSSIDVAAKNDYCQFDKHMSMVQNGRSRREKGKKERKDEKNGSERTRETETERERERRRKRTKEKEKKCSTSFRLPMLNDQVTFPTN